MRIFLAMLLAAIATQCFSDTITTYIDEDELQIDTSEMLNCDITWFDNKYSKFSHEMSYLDEKNKYIYRLNLTNTELLNKPLTYNRLQCGVMFDKDCIDTSVTPTMTSVSALVFGKSQKIRTDKWQYELESSYSFTYWAAKDNEWISRESSKIGSMICPRRIERSFLFKPN